MMYWLEVMLKRLVLVTVGFGCVALWVMCAVGSLLPFLLALGTGKVLFLLFYLVEIALIVIAWTVTQLCGYLTDYWYDDVVI